MEKSLKKLVIIGAGGLGREVAWLVDDINKENLSWDFIGFLDDGKIGDTVEGYLIIGKVDDIFAINPAPLVVIAIADAMIRANIYERLISKGMEFATLIHPSVLMSHHVSIEKGTVICAGSVITTNVKVGKSCIINPGCFVGHDTVLGDFVSLMPGVNVAGEVIVGKGTFLGLNSTVINRINVGVGSTIGAGAAVVKDIPDNVVAVGVPARVVRKLGV